MQPKIDGDVGLKILDGASSEEDQLLTQPTALLTLGYFVGIPLLVVRGPGADWLTVIEKAGALERTILPVPLPVTVRLAILDLALREYGFTIRVELIGDVVLDDRFLFTHDLCFSNRSILYP